MDVLRNLSGPERALLAVLTVLLAIALFMPAVPDPGANAAFADVRAWRGLPFALDVLSNLPFAAFGLWGFVKFGHGGPPRLPAPAGGQRCARLFLAGLVLTAVCSSLYHLGPDAVRLGVDRAGMTVVFAGMVGLAICERVSQRAGWPVACFVLAAGLAAVVICTTRGNVLPWAVVQFGGMALVATLAFLRPVPGALGLSLGAVIACYALAKLFELGDHAVYAATGELVSGHSLKHLVAACAAWPVLRAADRHVGAVRHNPRAAPATSVSDGPRSPTGTFE